MRSLLLVITAVLAAGEPTDAEIDRTLNVLSPRGLILRFQASSLEDANRIHDHVRAHVPTKESP